MAAFGGVAPAGDGLRYAEYSPPSNKRPDAEVDRGLVSPPRSRLSAALGCRSPASSPGSRPGRCAPPSPRAWLQRSFTVCAPRSFLQPDAALCPATQPGEFRAFLPPRGATARNRPLETQRCEGDGTASLYPPETQPVGGRW